MGDFASSTAAVDCSIIIPLFNRCLFTQICLDSLARIGQERYRREIILVDNASTDSTPQFLATLSGYRVIRNEVNLGFAGGCNKGASVANGKYLVFLNSDTVVQPNWLEAMVNLIESDSTIGVVGARLLYPNDTIQHGGVVFDKDKTPRHLHYGFPKDYLPATINNELQAVTGACLTVSRELFMDLGGFDEAYVNSYEDIDLCCKVRRAGRKVYYCGSSVIYHFESVSPGRHEFDYQNGRLFLERWSDQLEADEERWYVDEGFREVPRIAETSLEAIRYELLYARRRAEILQQHNDNLELSCVQLAAQLRALNRIPANPGLRTGADSKTPKTGPSAMCLATAPETMAPGSVATIPAVVVSRGLAEPSDSAEISLEYSWADMTGGNCLGKGVGAHLGHDLVRQSRFQTSATLRAPERVGTYLLSWHICRDGHPISGGDKEVPPQQVRVLPLLSAAYKVPPQLVVQVGRVQRVLVELANYGAKPWSPGCNVSLGYHIYDEFGRSCLQWEGRRTPVVEMAENGSGSGKVSVNAIVGAPFTPGKYILKWDLVEEGVAWFSSQGVPMPESVIEVREGSPEQGQLGNRHEPKDNFDGENGNGHLVDGAYSELAAVASLKDERIKELTEWVSSLVERAESLSFEVESLRNHLRAVENGRVLRALNSLQRIRRLVKL